MIAGFCFLFLQPNSAQKYSERERERRTDHTIWDDSAALFVTMATQHDTTEGRSHKTEEEAREGGVGVGVEIGWLVAGET